MVWKPKEKELTLEEALALAKKELTPFWIGSPPLLAPVKTKRQVTIYPLDTQWSETAWALFFVDPTDFAGSTTLCFAREMHRRYREHGLQTMGVVRPSYSFLMDIKTLEHFLRQNQISFPIVIDANLLISASLGIQAIPHLVVLHENKVISTYTGCNWLENTEKEMQNLLRRKDPGLALFPILKPDFPWFLDVLKWEFGRGKGMNFPTPGFGPPEKGFSTRSFPDTLNQPIEADEFRISGIWLQDAEKISTSDPHAKIKFLSPTPHMAIVAQSLSKSKEPNKIVVEARGFPVLDIFAGNDLGYDEEGQSVIRLETARLYDTFNKLPKKDMEIMLRFPNANRAPVALYGIRFCKPS